MARADLVRQQLFLLRAPRDRLDALAAKPCATRSSILVLVVAAYLDRRDANQLDDRLAQRLDRISGRLAMIERDRFAAFATRAGEQLASGRLTFIPEEVR